ncbi:MAG: hypothetical protein AB7G75_02535 [Candidatus Binatia bacterium]
MLSAYQQKWSAKMVCHFGGRVGVRSVTVVQSDIGVPPINDRAGDFGMPSFTERCLCL